MPSSEEDGARLKIEHLNDEIALLYFALGSIGHLRRLGRKFGFAVGVSSSLAERMQALFGDDVKEILLGTVSISDSGDVARAVGNTGQD